MKRDGIRTPPQKMLDGVVAALLEEKHKRDFDGVALLKRWLNGGDDLVELDSWNYILGASDVIRKSVGI